MAPHALIAGPRAGAADQSCSTAAAVPSRGGLAVILSGGAMVGAFQAGVVDSIARRRVLPDLVVGTSVGSLNAAVWAFDPGPNAGQHLLEVWEDAAQSHVFPRTPFPALARVLRGERNLASNAGLRSLIARSLPAGAHIDNSVLPLAITATDAVTGERMALRAGLLGPALLASAAIPGVFPAVNVGGRMAIDGGVVANVDIDAAQESGMTDVLVVDLMGLLPEQAAAGIEDAIERAAWHSLRRQTDLAIGCCAGARMRVALLRPSLPWQPRLGDFSRSKDLFSLGRIAGEGFLDLHLTSDLKVRPGRMEGISEAARTLSALAG